MADTKITFSILLKEKLSGPLAKINAMFAKLVKQLNLSSVAAKAFTRSMALLRRGLASLSKNAKSLVGTFNKIRKAVFNLKTAFTALIASVVIRNIIGVSADIEKRILEVSTLLGDVGEETIGKMRDDLIDLAVEGGQAIQDEIQAAYNAISAGVPTEQVVGFLKEANQLAVGGVTDVNTAVGLLTDVVRGYGLTFDQSNEAADSLFTTVRLGKTTISELASTIGRAAGPSAALNITLDQTGASLALLTTSLGSTERATTAYLGILRTLDKPTAEAQAAAAKYGLELSLTSTRQRGLNAIIKDFARIQKASAEDFRALFGEVTAFNGALALVQRDGQGFVDTLEQFASKSGAARAAFDKLSSSLLFSIQSLRTAFVGLIDELLDSKIPRLTAFVKELTETVQTLTRAIRAAEAGNLDVEVLQRVLTAGINVIATAAKGIARAVAITLIETVTLALQAATPAFQNIFRDILAPVLNDIFDAIPGLGGIDIEVGTLSKIREANKQLDQIVANQFRIESLNKQIREREEQLDVGTFRGDPNEERRNFIEPLKRQIGEMTRESARIFDELGTKTDATTVRLLTSRIASLRRLLIIEAEEASKAFGRSLADGLVTSTSEFSKIAPEVEAALRDLQNALTATIIPEEGIMGPPAPEVIGDAAEDAIPKVNQFAVAWNKVKSAVSFLNGETEFFLVLQARSLDARGETEAAARIALLIRQQKERNELEKAYGQQAQLLLPFLTAVQEQELLRFDANVSINQSLTSVIDAEQAYSEALRLRNSEAEAGKRITAEQEANLRALKNELRDAGEAAFTNLNLIANEQGFGTVVIPALERIRQILRGISEDAENTGTSFQDGIIQGMKDLREDAKITADDATNLMDGIRDSMVNNIMTGINGLIDGTMSFGEAFKSVAAGILKDIAMMIIKMLVFKLISAALGGFPIPFADGGKVPGFAEGGKTAGPPPINGKDNIPAMLQRDEWVIQPNASKYYGDGIMSAMNQRLFPKSLFGGRSGARRFSTGPAFATGGKAVGGSTPAPTPGLSIIVANDSTANRLLTGGRAGVLSFMNENAVEINRALGRA